MIAEASLAACLTGRPSASNSRSTRSPYIDRRRKVGWDLYGLLGIAKGDKLRMHEQHGRNYLFFDAPVGLIFTIDRVMQQGSCLDYGMFLQNIMIAARARLVPSARSSRYVVPSRSSQSSGSRWYSPVGTWGSA